MLSQRSESFAPCFRLVGDTRQQRRRHLQTKMLHQDVTAKNVENPTAVAQHCTILQQTHMEPEKVRVIHTVLFAARPVGFTF